MVTATANRNITDAILKITGLHKAVPVYYVNATVNNVDIAKRTCNVTAIDGNVEFDIPNVMLMAVVDDGVLFAPTIGSTVKVIYSLSVEPFVCQYSELDNITLSADILVKFNDGSFGGLVKIQTLLQKINNLETQLNMLGVWALTVAPPLTLPPIILTQLIEIENTKVKHGI